MVWCAVALIVFLSTAFNILVNFGIAITYPTLISLGIVLSVPVNASKCWKFPSSPNLKVTIWSQFSNK